MTPAVRLPQAIRAAAGLAVLVTLLGCGPRYARRPVESDPLLTVFLRAEHRDGELVDRGLRHPVTVAPVRLAHILAQIDVRTGDETGERRAALPTELLYAASEAISRALEEATPAEEVVLQALRKERRFGLFSSDYLTTLIAYQQQDGRLYLHFRHVDWELPKDTRGEIPEPWVHRTVSPFRVLPGNAMQTVGPQEVAVLWRDPEFGKAERLRVGRGGRLERRTILMESDPGQEPDPAAAGPAPEASGRLSPTALRELADLEEERRAGRLTEAEYQARRRAILAAEETLP